MFEKNAAMLLYCVSPVHMGAGSATGVIDNPIQREVHTGHPSFAGSGLKGAVRHGFTALGGDTDKANILFGPSSGDLSSGAVEHHSGAVSFGDAQLVLFPVRSRRRGYVYATCPLALSRAQRLLWLSGVALDWKPPTIDDGYCQVTESGQKALCSDDSRLHLEVFEYRAESSSDVAAIADWLAENAIAGDSGSKYFRDKLKRDLVVLSDSDFDYYSRNATVVEPHVRINEETGTADNGGLFYSENLPPETVMLAPLMASRELSGGADPMPAESIMGHMQTALAGQLLQIGGDATTGRGLVMVNLVEGA